MTMTRAEFFDGALEVLYRMEGRVKDFEVVEAIGEDDDDSDDDGAALPDEDNDVHPAEVRTEPA